MNPTELFSFRQCRWFENIILVSFLTTLVTAGFIVLGVASGSNDTPLATAAAVGALIATFSGIAGGGISVARYETKRKEAVFSRLEPLSTTDLVTLCGSPEVEDGDRKMVIEYLNARRTGWSFSVSTTNTTAR